MHDFILLVKAMRDAQKAYFENGRHKQDLIKAISLAKAVDKYIENTINDKKK